MCFQTNLSCTVPITATADFSFFKFLLLLFMFYFILSFALLHQTVICRKKAGSLDSFFKASMMNLNFMGVNNEEQDDINLFFFFFQQAEKCHLLTTEHISAAHLR